MTCSEENAMTQDDPWPLVSSSGIIAFLSLGKTFVFLTFPCLLCMGGLPECPSEHVEARVGSSFHPRDQTQVIRPGDKHPYPLSQSITLGGGGQKAASAYV